MCGIIGIYSQDPVASQLYDGLIHLQHRGQDAAGMVSYDPDTEDHFHIKRGLGLVQEIFSSEAVQQLKGQFGLGHTRYPTAGGYELSNVQPLCLEAPRLLALAHNGNLTNYQELAAPFSQRLLSSSDSEALLLHFSNELSQELPEALGGPDFFEALCRSISHLMQRAQGSYSAIALAQGAGLIAFRDPHGIRPLVFGERPAANGKKDYIFASESSMFYSLGFQTLGDVEPGELIYVDLRGQLQRRSLNKKQFSPCIFEYVYFSRPDSVINQASVYRTRMNLGQNLAQQWKKQFPDLLPDIVIPVPFTSNTAALSFANEIGVRYSEGLYKNPFIGRTFIMSDGKKRSRGVRHKLTPQRMEIEGKKILLVDDSLVRGTTSFEIVKMVREYGAKEIYFTLACPPIRHPCFYGIDLPSRRDLIAANLSLEEIRAHLGVDQLLYLELDHLVEAVARESKNPICSPCLACMNGNYIAGKFSEENIEKLEQQRQKEKMTS